VYAPENNLKYDYALETKTCFQLLSTMRLKLKLLSTFTCNFNLRRYHEADQISIGRHFKNVVEMPENEKIGYMVVWCRLDPGLTPD